MQDAIDNAVTAAEETYENARQSPFDHGVAMVVGLDGRTSLAHACKEHARIDVSNDSYHGTTVTIDGMSRYLNPQAQAYKAFIDTLLQHDIDVQNMRVWTHQD